MKQTDKNRLKELMCNFNEAWKELTVFWDVHADEVDEVMRKAYPFEGCFGELAVDVNNWKENVTEQVNKMGKPDFETWFRLRVRMTQKQFIAAYEDVDSDAPVMIVFPGELYIEEYFDGKYYLNLTNQSYSGEDIGELATKLYDYYINNHYHGYEF